MRFGDTSTTMALDNACGLGEAKITRVCVQFCVDWVQIVGRGRKDYKTNDTMFSTSYLEGREVRARMTRWGANASDTTSLGVGLSN